ncbi:MAG: DinB family protein [Bacteroidota bacterium]
MIRTIVDFQHVWSRELESTQKLFKHLTDRSLGEQVDPEGRTLGRLAWHITRNITEAMEITGLSPVGPADDAPVPASAKEIFKAYSDAAIALLEQVTQKWTDATLAVKDQAYGRQWERGATLTALVHHLIHHRGQMTVLMRQAGLQVPGLFGPARQEWRAFGKEPPAV